MTCKLRTPCQGDYRAAVLETVLHVSTPRDLEAVLAAADRTKENYHLDVTRVAELFRLSRLCEQLRTADCVTEAQIATVFRGLR